MLTRATEYRVGHGGPGTAALREAPSRDGRDGPDLLLPAWDMWGSQRSVYTLKGTAQEGGKNGGGFMMWERGP